MSLSNWESCERPGGTVLTGQHVRLEPLDWDKHGAGLFDAVAGTGSESIWTYMPIGPFTDLNGFRRVFGAAHDRGGWQTLVICSTAAAQVLGMASYMRIREAHGSCEVGAVAFSHALQRTPEASEAMYLMARHVFEDLGYRRYEWKCHNENQRSKRAAARFGFQFEGVFRNDMVIKGKNRDTAWFAMTDDDWPKVKAGFETWLAADNFAVDGQQIKRLEDCRV